MIAQLESSRLRLAHGAVMLAQLEVELLLQGKLVASLVLLVGMPLVLVNSDASPVLLVASNLLRVVASVLHAFLAAFPRQLVRLSVSIAMLENTLQLQTQPFANLALLAAIKFAPDPTHVTLVLLALS